MQYIITYSKARHGYVRLMSDMTLKLTIPHKKAGDKNFEKILIEKGLELIEKYKKRNIVKFETITKDYVIVFGEKINFSKINGDINKYLKEIFIIESTKYLDKYSSFLGINYNKLSVRKLKSKWGSCSHTNNISLNLNLIHLDKKFLEYVVVHEICHLKEKNHSKNFWNLVFTFYPDYKEIRKELKKISL
ncbi:MAG: M48 family metallopeptidase [Candidatus Gracilibacteria bacterium]|nr:M48 family metallopeptidase [Candidatus Gracilibacteria bacterium]